MVVDWTERKLKPYGYMTRKQMIILHWLISQADEYGDIWHPLDQFHWRTVDNLHKNLLLVKSDGVNGVEYCITSHGRKLFDIFLNTPKPRADGICPRCEQAPVGPHGYCRPCGTKVRRLWTFNHPNHEPYGDRKTCRDCDRRRPLRDGLCKSCDKKRRRSRGLRFADKVRDNPPLCPICQTRPREVRKTQVESYCNHCRKEVRRKKYDENKRNRLRLKIAQIARADVKTN